MRCECACSYCRFVVAVVVAVADVELVVIVNDDFQCPELEFKQKRINFKICFDYFLQTNKTFQTLL